MPQNQGKDQDQKMNQEQPKKNMDQTGQQGSKNVEQEPKKQNIDETETSRSGGGRSSGNTSSETQGGSRQ